MFGVLQAPLIHDQLPVRVNRREDYECLLFSNCSSCRTHSYSLEAVTVPGTQEFIPHPPNLVSFNTTLNAFYIFPCVFSVLIILS
jgi:hypothetical protein